MAGGYARIVDVKPKGFRIQSPARLMWNLEQHCESHARKAARRAVKSHLSDAEHAAANEGRARAYREMADILSTFRTRFRR